MAELYIFSSYRYVKFKIQSTLPRSKIHLLQDAFKIDSQLLNISCGQQTQTSIHFPLQLSMSEVKYRGGDCREMKVNQYAKFTGMKTKLAPTNLHHI